MTERQTQNTDGQKRQRDKIDRQSRYAQNIYTEIQEEMTDRLTKDRTNLQTDRHNRQTDRQKKQTYRHKIQRNRQKRHINRQLTEILD